MPGVEDWIQKPLEAIQNIIDHLPHGVTEISSVKDYFSKKLQSQDAHSWVPSINYNALHNLAADSLVRYRCMVQDMFNPELYLTKYLVTNLKTGTKCMRSGHYRDVATCGLHEEIHIDASQNVTHERMTLYCVPVPGEATWVKSHYDSESKQTNISPPLSSPSCRQKRGRDDEENSMEINSCENNEAEVKRSAITTCNGQPANHPEASGGVRAYKTPDLNFPLPLETGPACLVKLYDEDEGLKVNDVVEVIGVLSVDPSLAGHGTDEEETDTLTAAEQIAHRPPPSLVPRLHAVLVRKLVHNNPLLPADLKMDSITDHPVTLGIQSKMTQVRAELISVLEQALCWDRLAAEYLLCQMVSSVYAFVDAIPLGKMSLNLSGQLAANGLASHLHQLIAKLMTQSHLLPLSLDNMNTLCLSPSKDYDANRLRSGQLQLSSGTHLTLDETALNVGMLNTQGVKNVTALANLIKWQTVTYDFLYHTQDYPTNVAVLIVSEGESFLPKDVLVTLRPTSVPSDLRDHFEQLERSLTDEMLNQFRVYLTVCKHMQYSMDDAVQKALQEEFVNARKDNPLSMSTVDFHRLLSLVRLLTLTYCTDKCTPEILHQVLDLEKQRCARLPESAK